MSNDLEESSDAATPDDLPPRPVLRSGPPRQHRSKKRLYVAGSVVLVAIGFLIYKGVTSAFVYFKTADQAVADRSSLGNSTFDIEGTVIAHTIHHGSGAASTFEIYSGHTTVTVDNTAVPPDLFQGGVPVVLVGHFIGSSNTFASEQILVKHSNQYKAEYPGRVRSSNGAIN